MPWCKMLKQKQLKLKRTPQEMIPGYKKNIRFKRNTRLYGIGVNNGKKWWYKMIDCETVALEI